MLDIKYEMSELETWPKGFKGIYAIYSKTTDKAYIGKTKYMRGGFRGRWLEHRRILRNNEHYNIYMQRSYNKHGEKDFYFKILEICNDDLKTKELKWIDKLQTMCYQKGWNIDTHERDEKRNSKYFPRPRTVLNFEFIDPNGNLIKGTNLAKFADKFNLNRGDLNRLFHGKIFSHKGYKSVNPEFHYKPKKYELISPQGILHTFSNIVHFSKEHNLWFANVSHVLSDKTAHTKGWHKPNPLEKFKKWINRQVIHKKIVSPNGQIHQFISGKGFHTKYNLIESEYKRIVKKKQTVKGWRLATAEDETNLPRIKESF